MSKPALRAAHEPIASGPGSTDAGAALHAFAAQLYPICRSITGGGVRRSLQLIAEHIPLTIHEVPSGRSVFDWDVPVEWNVDDASVTDADGRRVVDFQQHNLHLVSYSEPVAQTLHLADLDQRLHSLPDRPTWIPYRTSYYRRSWGFCLTHEVRQALRPGRYRVEIESSLAPGSLTYGECVIPGRSREEVLFFTHVCHPSLANDNCAGMSVVTALAEWVAAEQRRYTYRFVFAPGTIGSLCWLKANEQRLGRIKGGLVLGLLGDPGPLTYKQSRSGATETDATARHVLQQIDPAAVSVPFSPYGYDERQLCSPGFDLPIGRLTRSVNDGYPQYHSSADDLELIRPHSLQQSLAAAKLFVTVLDENRRYVNLCPKGEPRLGKRGLYGSVGGTSPAEREHAMLWVLNQSDGTRSLLDIALRSGMPFDSIREAARALEQAKLLAAPAIAQRTRAGTSKVTGGKAARKTSRRSTPSMKHPRATTRAKGAPA
jgi:aminopeptidase-like protein